MDQATADEVIVSCSRAAPIIIIVFTSKKLAEITIEIDFDHIIVFTLAANLITGAAFDRVITFITSLSRKATRFAAFHTVGKLIRV
ncbi:MAG: hypothetical protein A2V67_15060 [Deltaproteobacteria bacterium RBG_13_61_14]|nr:MAG: hypothetical protein A2V67_15060 [Deltaproteobacteria bacterium RBG_13_61_14]